MYDLISLVIVEYKSRLIMVIDIKIYIGGVIMDIIDNDEYDIMLY